MRKNLGELRDEARGVTPARDYIILSGSGEGCPPPTLACCPGASLALCMLPQQSHDSSYAAALLLPPCFPWATLTEAALTEATPTPLSPCAPMCPHVPPAVYNMDMARLVAFHREKNADVTIAMHAVGEEDARGKGIAQVHPSSCE